MILSPKQILAIQQATHRYNIWVGSVRAGKTFSSIIKLTELIRSGIPGDIMIIGVNRGTVQRNVLNDLYKLFGWPPPSSKTNEAKMYGRNVYFVGANDEGAVKAIKGATLAYAYVDEATDIPRPFWSMMQSRLSLKGSQCLATCNPDGPNHWLKKEFIDRSNDLDLIYWNFTLDDNPSLDEVYKTNIKKEYVGMWYKRYILGQWAVAQGMIWDSFDHDNLYSRPMDNPNYYILGIDYGTSNATAAVLAAVSPNKWPQIRIEEEYYWDSVKQGRQKTDAELADDIKRLIGYRSVQAIYVDPSAASLKLELRNHNLPVLDANNDVIEGIKLTHKFIANKNLVIHQSCKTLIECIQSYAWCPKAAERGEDKPLKVKEHICDALRYCCYSAFPGGCFSHPDENLTIEQLRRKVYGGDDHLGFMGTPSGGYL